MKATEVLRGRWRTLGWLFVVAGGTLSTGSARADATYRLFYGNPQIVDTVTTIPQRASHSSSDANGLYSEQCYAIPGRVLASARMSDSSYGTDGARAFATADDFVITGPEGPPVHATLFFTVRVDLQHSGVAVDNSTSASASVQFEEDQDNSFAFAAGDAVSGNGGSYGDGALASYAGGIADQLVSFDATIAVGAPFGVHLGVWANLQANDPAMLDAYVAAAIGDANGHVMDLPPGYTVNSATWGVADNVSIGAVTAVPRAGKRALEFSPPTPNPSSGTATLSYVLPRAGRVRIRAFDASGRMVRAISIGEEGAGPHRVVWDARRDLGDRKAGLYFARLEFEDQSITRRLVILH